MQGTFPSGDEAGDSLRSAVAGSHLPSAGECGAGRWALRWEAARPGAASRTRPVRRPAVLFNPEMTTMFRAVILHLNYLKDPLKHLMKSAVIL